ncbi:sigma-70 family RNA polymerase sigma factor [Erwinia endophytica]|uniref:sigma-70 family RNA polymerase sigma factor n=1 Tax=Erwinia endophytica TaxID=1563158 RepID=UPI001265F656|nr:sigma-70 family RNA polymerase sigma factor [Erwinia endophytica]KAB8313347.1 sigma-70 family RNA polymerase sigma factor [Erwinia endophytica]
MDKSATARDQWPRLMAQAQAGDQQAYTRLLTALVPIIRSMVRKKIDDRTLVEDVIQDVLLTIHRIRHTYDPASPFLPWLMVITQARTIDALRRRSRQRHWEVGDDEAVMPPSIETPSLPERQDPRDELATYLQQLSIRQRKIVEHVHLKEMSLAEAALQNNLTVSAVKSLLHRALTNLRRFGAKHGRS